MKKPINKRKFRAKLFYVDRKVGKEIAYEIAEEQALSEGYVGVQRYGVHLKKTPKRGYKDWVLRNGGTGILGVLCSEVLRQAQLDLVNGRAKKYFCFMFINYEYSDEDIEKLKEAGVF